MLALPIKYLVCSLITKCLKNSKNAVHTVIGLSGMAKPQLTGNSSQLARTKYIASLYGWAGVSTQQPCNGTRPYGLDINVYGCTSLQTLDTFIHQRCCSPGITPKCRHKSR